MKKNLAFTFAGVLLASGMLCYILCFGGNQNPEPFVPPSGTVPLRISVETTIVTEPLLPDGTGVDFFAVLDNLCSDGADSADNGFRDIVRLLGRNIFGDITDQQWTILCEKLNLNPDDPPQFEYVKPDFGFNVAGDSELLERWVTEMSPAITAVAEALNKPLYVVPPAGRLSDNPVFQSGHFAQFKGSVDWPDDLPGTMAQRAIAEMFSHRFMYLQDKQDAEKAWDDVLSMFCIVRRFCSQPFPNAANFINAFEKMAAYYAEEFLKIESIDAAQLRQCLADLDSLPVGAQFEDTLEYQRFGWLKNIAEFPQNGPIAFGHRLIEMPDHPLISPTISEDDKMAIVQINKEMEITLRIYREVPFDWNIIAEIMNAEFDDRLGKPAKQAVFQSNPALRKIYDETVVPGLSEDEMREILAGGSISVLMERVNKLPHDVWNIDRLTKLTLEERSVYLGKAFFASRVLTPERFALQNSEGVATFEKVKTAIALQLSAEASARK